MILIRNGNIVFGLVECGFPWQFSLLTASAVAIFMVLFVNYYVHEYKMEKKEE